jgi:hypothetical protein
MKTIEIALIIAFSTLTIVLNIVIVPSLYWPGFNYRIYEIVMVVAFMLFGFKIGTAVTALNVLGQMLFFPVSGGIVAYPFGMIAVLVMMGGVYSANYLFQNRFLEGRVSRARMILYLTIFGIAARVIIMPFLDYGILYHILLPAALNVTIPETYILALLPGMIVFNITIPLYTIPIAYVIAKKVNNSIKIEKTNKGVQNFNFQIK